MYAMQIPSMYVYDIQQHTNRCIHQRPTTQQDNG